MHHKQKNHYYTASKVAWRLMRSPIVLQFLFVYFLHYIFHIMVCKKEFLSFYLFFSNSFHLNIEVPVTHTNICWKALKELLKTEVVSFRSSTTCQSRSVTSTSLYPAPGVRPSMEAYFNRTITCIVSFLL